MRISIIVAADLNNGIGYQNQIPWHLPKDLANFKTRTIGHHIRWAEKPLRALGNRCPVDRQ
jgi:dihydrofolate reductase